MNPPQCLWTQSKSLIEIEKKQLQEVCLDNPHIREGFHPNVLVVTMPEEGND